MPRKTNGKGKTQKATPKATASKKLLKKTAARKRSASAEGLAFSETDKNEQRLNLALEAAQMAVWEYDLHDSTVQWSDNIHTLFGLTKRAFDGTFETYLNLIHREDRKKVIDTIQEAISKKAVYSIEHRIVWPNGSIHWLENIGKITADSRQKPVKITGTIQDISKKKALEFEREDWKTRHELISTSAGLVIYDYDLPTGRILWSGNSDLVLGYTAEELGNIDRWVALIHPEDRDQAFSLLEVAESNLETYDVYYRFQKKDGDYCYMHDRGFFVPDQYGRAVRMLGMMSDVTKTILAEKTIKENNQFRESIENAMPDILYVHDLRTRRYIYTNKNLEHKLGYSIKDLEEMGNFFEKIVHPDDLQNVPTWTDEPNGIVKETEFRIRLKDGTYRWLATRDTPFRWEGNGNVSHVIGVAQDITSRKEFLNQLNKSEQSYRELFDTVGEAIYIQNTDGVFIDVNKGACLMYGYEKKELIGQTQDFLSAEGENDFEAIRYRMKKAIAGKPQTFEFWGRKKKGEIFLQEIRLTRGSYFGQEIIISTGRDITQRRNTEQALRDSEQRFRTLQQASFGGIGLHDKGAIIDCNQGLCDLTGYSYNELIGFNGLELIAPEWRSFVLEKIQTGYEKPYDVEGIRKDRSRYILEIHGKNIPYEGRPIRVTEFRDVTERKRSEEKILEQNSKLLSLTEDLVRKNNQLEEFTQIVSHNLRSPVGNIVTLLNFFEGALSDEERKEYFNLLKESSATTLYMLNDLNEVLKIKQNKKIDMQELKFETVLQQVKSMVNAKVSQMSAEIIYDFSKAPVITYPAIYLESILLNLLDNALKYAHPDRQPRVEFRTYINQQGNVTMEIKDNGLGINLEKYGHHIFKLRKTFHRHPESRGIGLFMIKNQIEATGGDITMVSKENEGSTFFINFNKTQTDAS
jgi:PAS domain S-box-containing protein